LSNYLQNDQFLIKKINYKEINYPFSTYYGLIGIESDAIKNLNIEIKEEVTENIDHKITIDDFTSILYRQLPFMV
jgi:hypothetical protein